MARKALIAAFDVASGKVRGTIGDTPHRGGFRVVPGQSVRLGAGGAMGGGLRQPQHPHVRRGGPPWSLSSAASTKTSGRRGNPASSSQWRHARRSCAMPVTGSPSTSRPSMPLGSTRSRSGSPSWFASSSAAATSPPRASPAEDRELHRLLQCHDGEAVPLDHEGQAAGGVRVPKRVGISGGVY